MNQKSDEEKQGVSLNERRGGCSNFLVISPLVNKKLQSISTWKLWFPNTSQSLDPAETANNKA